MSLNMKAVLLLCPQKRSSGNLTTAARLSEHFESFGYDVRTEGLEDGVRLLSEQTLPTQHLTVLSIHAYKSAPLLEVLSDDVKFMVIFGGTDLNENAKQKEHCNVMAAVVKRACHCIAFNRNMRDVACGLWPEIKKKVHVIHQGVSTLPNPQFNLKSHLLDKHNYKALDDVILLVAGIRPIKDPHHLLHAFADSTLSKMMSFVIVGALVDEVYGKQFIADVSHLRNANVLYIGELSLHDTHAAMSQSFCLVNSSISEGMCGAILEAFDLRVPVVARDIPGNSSLIDHMTTGLLYGSPQEFVQLVKTLLESPWQRDTLTSNAKEALERNHSKERQLYGALLKSQ